MKSIKDLQNSARDFIQEIRMNSSDSEIQFLKGCFAFYGEMGAGKTTFIKALCNELKVKNTVTSPTFALINEYHTFDNQIIYHFDFYRINTIEEVYDFGYEEYFFSNRICFIEWPEKIESLLPPNFYEVHITVNYDGSRSFELKNK